MTKELKLPNKSNIKYASHNETLIWWLDFLRGSVAPNFSPGKLFLESRPSVSILCLFHIYHSKYCPVRYFGYSRTNILLWTAPWIRRNSGYRAVSPSTIVIYFFEILINLSSDNWPSGLPVPAQCFVDSGEEFHRVSFVRPKVHGLPCLSLIHI